jgi:hypothetical protein
VPFTSSFLVQEGWPEQVVRDRYENAVFARAQLAHKVIFTMIHNETVPSDVYCLYWYDTWKGRSFFYDFVDLIAEVGALAEFYGCLDIVGPKLTEVVLNQMRIWEAVAASPRGFMQLGEKFRSPKLYFDALRHAIVQEDAKFHNSSSRDDSRLELVGDFEHELHKLHCVIEDLRRSLNRLGLTECDSGDDGVWRTRRTSLFNALLFKRKPRPQKQRRSEKCDYLARLIYLQWLTKMADGDHIFKNATGKPRYLPGGGLRLACKLLVDAAGSQDPQRIRLQGRSSYHFCFWDGRPECFPRSLRYSRGYHHGSGCNQRDIRDLQGQFPSRRHIPPMRVRVRRRGLEGLQVLHVPAA